jgi:hypothetical protein
MRMHHMDCPGDQAHMCFHGWLWPAVTLDTGAKSTFNADR